jgi:hypothetical protein
VRIRPGDRELGGDEGSGMAILCCTLQLGLAQSAGCHPDGVGGSHGVPSSSHCPLESPLKGLWI